MENQYLTSKQAAQYLGVSIRTIQHWVRVDRLKAYRIGSHKLRFRTEDLDAMVQPVRPSA